MYTRANPDWNVDCKCSSSLWMIQMLLRVCSLDPDGDPLCVLLMLDYYALRAGEYGFLINLFREWEVLNSYVIGGGGSYCKCTCTMYFFCK